MFLGRNPFVCSLLMELILSCLVYYIKYFIITNEHTQFTCRFIRLKGKNQYLLNFGIKTVYPPNQNIDIYFLFAINLL